MIKVKNNKTIKRIAVKSFKANKTRNLIAVMAIALTAILFTTLFTMTFSTVKTFQQQTIRQSCGDGHGVLKYITDEQYNAVKDHPLIEEISYNFIIASSVDNPEFLKRPVEMMYMDDIAMKLGFRMPTEGSTPKAENEIIVDTNTLDLLGVPHQIGVTVPLMYTMNGKQAQTTFVLSGYWESDPIFNVGTVIVSKKFVNTHSAELDYNNRENGDISGAINSYIMFKNSWNMEEKLHRVITESGYVWDDKNAPNYIVSNINWAYLLSNNTGDPITIIAVLAAAALIILTGYLIIYNIFEISVNRDIRFYGLLKTIGTTGKQIKRIINRQALLLSAIGIPIGIVIGFFIGRAMVPTVMSVTNFSAEEISVSLSPWIFIGSALFALITVKISMRKPGKIAANVSPVETVRYTSIDAVKGKKTKNSTNGGKISKMAFSNLGRNKKRTVFVVISMSLSLILLNTVFTMSRGIDMDKFLSRFVDTDFLIGHANYFGREKFNAPRDELSESFIEAVNSQPGFEKGGRLYYNIYVEDASIDYDIRPTDQSNKAQDGKSILDLYGLDDLPLSRLDIVDGEDDPAVLLEKMKTGKYIIEGMDSDDHGKLYPESSHYDIGDTVTINIDGKSHSYELLAKTRANYYTNTKRSLSKFMMYLPVKEYLKVVNRPVLMSYAFNVVDNKEADMEEFSKDYTKNIEPMMNYESKNVLLKDFNNLRTMLLMVGGILSLIIGLIGILNFINSMLTSIITRRQEFAMLQSIGMTGRQLQKMLCFEGVYYAIGTILCSLVIGVIFSITVVGGVVSQLWFFSYRFVIWPLLSIYPVLILLSVLVPIVALHSLKKQSVVERLREME